MVPGQPHFFYLKKRKFPSGGSKICEMKWQNKPTEQVRAFEFPTNMVERILKTVWSNGIEVCQLILGICCWLVLLLLKEVRPEEVERFTKA